VSFRFPPRRNRSQEGIGQGSEGSHQRRRLVTQQIAVPQQRSKADEMGPSSKNRYPLGLEPELQKDVATFYDSLKTANLQEVNGGERP